MDVSSKQNWITGSKTMFFPETDCQWTCPEIPFLSLCYFCIYFFGWKVFWIMAAVKTLPTNCQNQQQRGNIFAANVHPLVFVVLCGPFSQFFFFCVLTVQLYSSPCLCSISVPALHFRLKSLHKYTTVFSVVLSAHTKKATHNTHLLYQRIA